MNLSGVHIADLVANRPAPTEPGRLFFALDTGAIYRDSGTGWDFLPIATQVAEFVNAQTGTSYEILSGHLSNLITFSNGSAIAVTIPQATGGFHSSGFGAGWFVDVRNLGAGTVTITPTTSTIGGASTLVLAAGESARIVSDGTNYQVFGLVRTTFAESAVIGLVSDLALKAPLASPTFTGTPAAPTPSTADSSTKLATTAYVQAQGYLTSGTGPGNGSIATKTAAYTVLASDYTLVGDATSATFAFTLPVAPTSGEIHNFKKIDSTAHDITIDGNGKTIDGGATLTISAQYASFSVQYDGTQWWVL